MNNIERISKDTPLSLTQRSISNAERHNSLEQEPIAAVSPLSTRNLNSLTRRPHLMADPIESASSKRKLPMDFDETLLERMYNIT